MKADLEEIMRQKGADAIIITGPADHNPAMVYFTGIAHLSSATIIKKLGQEPVLFHHPMERGEAAKSGLRTISYSQYPGHELLREANGDPARMLALRYQRMLVDLGIVSGRVMLYGRLDAGLVYSLFSLLGQAMPGLEFSGDLGEDILPAAMSTKSPEEVARIRHMGQVTTAVVGEVADFLSNQAAKEGVLVFSSGEPVTIADVKRRISLSLAQRGAENPEEPIFSTGQDAGVPHSTGDPGGFLRLGQPIIFDIFPCEAGGGYFYDFTRTWCLGYATDQAQALYDQVYAVYRQLSAELKVGATCSYYQKRACELFEAMGHPTVLNTPLTETGYVHGLGHGVGLNLQEKPWFRYPDPNEDQLLPGTVMTLEPGLYYPERGLGVRLEDTYYYHPDGRVEVLADYPLDLVLPVKKQSG